RTYIVIEAWEGEFHGAHPAAYGRFGLQQQNLNPLLLPGDSRCQPIGTGADNDGIEGWRSTHGLTIIALNDEGHAEFPENQTEIRLHPAHVKQRGARPVPAGVRCR